MTRRKTILLSIVAFLALASLYLTSCTSASCSGQQEEIHSAREDHHAPAEESACSPPGNRNVDIPNPVNHGILDDRTTRYEYIERKIGDHPAIWGTYRIAAGTVTNGSSLSPRMERKFHPRVDPKDGNYQHFKGTFRIEQVGEGRGTYIIQAKGRHHGHVDVDPALCLIVAREVVRDGQTYFDLYREEITKRGGRFSNGGRRDVKLTTVRKNENFDLEMKTGFSGNPVNRHYVDVMINGKCYAWDVPSPQAAIHTGIRYGAYSVRSGTATVNVCNTFYSYRNKKNGGR